MNLIPDIEIGKKYLLRYRPYERICPHCKALLGTTVPPFEKVVTVIAGPPGHFVCGICDQPIGDAEGYYLLNITAPSGRPFAVPYTQLEEIEEEQDETKGHQEYPSTQDTGD
ncbi:hypothetical protein LCGC14_2534250 [marine sediment metagenome]|uniref:Uncharacterized protein n=1 Tax=marine sediment metagenome TaxID=412755 RepID=A0A0F9D442_9ZZZZ